MTWDIAHHARRSGIKRIEGEVLCSVAEVVLLALASEHAVRDLGGRDIITRGDDLGLAAPALRRVLAHDARSCRRDGCSVASSARQWFSRRSSAGRAASIA